MLFFISGSFVNAQQRSDNNLDPAFIFGIDYGYNFVGLDMKDRFGNNMEVASKFSYLFEKSSWQLGLKASYFFGDTVKQDVLAHLRDPNGHIIGINKDYAQVKLRSRGFQLGAFASKVFPIGSKSSVRSGIRIDLGISLFQHWIRLQDDYNTVAQFDDPYQEGYDRLTNGLALNQFIGYQYMSADRRINFYAGFDFVQAFTESRRDYDFASMGQDLEPRKDLMTGIKIGWILPIYLETQPDEIFY